MNDFLFLILIENLTPNTNASEELRPWFVVTSNSWRLKLSRNVAEKLPSQLPERHIPFLLARTVTAGVFAMLVVWFGWQAWRNGDPSRLPEAAFLTLAWFFLLLPTQNPWYWIWALPFVPFARSKVWLVLSGLLLAYYLRFWLGYHWPDGPVPMTTYSGKLFFDYIVTWMEFGPWFVWLFYAKIRRNVMLHTERNGVPATIIEQHDR